MIRGTGDSTFVNSQEVDLLKKIELFAGFDDKILDGLAKDCQLITITPKDRICKAGGVIEGLYLILDGSIKLLNERVPGSPFPVEILRQGACFGQESLLSETTASFSIYGDSASCTLLMLSKTTFDHFLAGHPDLDAHFKAYMAHDAIRRFLQKTPFFRHVSQEKLGGLIKVLQTRTLGPGQLLIKQGDPGTEAYIVKQGEFKLFFDDAPDTGNKIVKPGDLVGEIALIKDVKRTMNVAAKTKACVFVIPKKAFLDLLEDHRDLNRLVDHMAARRLDADQARMTEKKKRAPGKAGSGEDAPPQQDAPDREVPPIRFDGGSVRLKYRLGLWPSVRQQSVMDCGAACLATVCSYYGKRVSLNRMRELARVGRSGASMLNLCKAAQTLGFETTPVLSTMDHLSASHLPAIVNWNGYHWIVVHRVTPDYVMVADPGDSLKKMPKDEFIDGWTRYSIFLTPTEKIKEIQEATPTLKQFRHYVKPFKKVVMEIGLASLLIQVLSMFMPIFTKFVIDDVVIKQNNQWLVLSVLTLSVLALVNLIVSYCRQNLLLSVSFKISLRMVSDFYEHLLSLPLTFFERRKVGDITSRFQENETITDFMTNTGVQVFLNMVTALLYLVLMFYFNVVLTITACFILFLNVFVLYFVTPRLQHSYKDAFQKGADAESFLIESVNGAGTIKVLGIENITRWIWENLYVSFTNAYFKTVKYGMISNLLSGLVNHVGDLAVLFIGALMVLKGDMSIGTLVAFTLLVKGVSSPINQLVGAWDTFQETLNSVEKINDVLETTPEVTHEQEKNLINVPTLRGHVTFEALTFRYEQDAKSNVLQNISLEVAPGQRIAFVGRSGSGKSTLIKLLLGFYPPSSGKISIDGFDLANIKPASLRSQIGVVPQQSILFKGTIRENIAKTRPGAPMAAIIEAAKLANAHDFITGFSKGYETILEERGSNLSGGQRQRICIARMFLQDPSLLILDEATSALDNESERFVQQNIDHVFNGRTVFIIAHRLSTVRHCDRIVVIDKGNILEQGTHEALMARKGLYFFLSTQQLSL